MRSVEVIVMTDIQRAMLGDHDAAARLTEQGVLIPCPFCGARIELRSGDYFGLYKTKCVFCGAESPQEGNEVMAIHRSNTRAPLLTPEQMDEPERMESKRDE